MFPHCTMLAGSQRMPFGKFPVWRAFLELEDIHESAQPCDFFSVLMQKASGKTFPMWNLLRQMWEHINHGFLQKKLGLSYLNTAGPSSYSVWAAKLSQQCWQITWTWIQPKLRLWFKQIICIFWPLEMRSAMVGFTSERQNW